MTRHRLTTLSPSDSQLHIVTANSYPDAVAQARRTHAERTGDSPDAIHVTTRDRLHPIWTPVTSDMNRDLTQVRTS